MTTQSNEERQAMEAQDPAADGMADVLVATLRTSRLTVLTGAPGAGKTRLLHLQLLPRLRRRADDLSPAAAARGALGDDVPTDRRRRMVRPREWVIFCDHWDGSPADQVHARLDEATGTVADASRPRLPVALRAKAISAEHAARLLFVFDHGDRIVAAPSDAVDPAAEYDALVNALCSVSPSVHLLVSTRENGLPPSVQSRVGSPDTRVLRLPDPAASTIDDPDVVASGRPLETDDVYTSIAERLAVIADRAGVPAGAPASPPIRRLRPLRAAPERLEPWTPPPVAPEEAAPLDLPPPDVPPPDVSPPGVPPPSTPDEVPDKPPPFVRGSFAEAAALRRSRSARRSRAVVGALVLLLLGGIGLLLWQDRVVPDLGALRSERRVAEASSPPSAAPTVPDAAPRAAVESAATSSATAAAPSSAPAPAPAPAPSEPAAASAPSVAVAGSSPALPASTPIEPPARATGPELAGESGLADDLWREMSRHGVARLGVRGAVDPVDALSAGRRLAVVPYDALRTLAGARGVGKTARVVAPLFTEEIHVVVRADSPLTFIHQLAGRRVDVGPPQGVRHATAVAFLQRLFDRPPAADQIRTEDLDTALAEMLNGGGIDAIILAEPQPSAWLTHLPPAQRRRLKLLGAAPDDPSTRRALREYLPATVSAPLAGGPAVRSFSVMTFLVANPSTSVGRDDTAAVAAGALCRSLPDLRRDGHPKWREVDPALRLPVPLPYDPDAVAALRACATAGAEPAPRRPPIAVSLVDPTRPPPQPPRGKRE